MGNANQAEDKVKEKLSVEATAKKDNTETLIGKKKSEPLRPGYVWAKRKGTEGNPVQLPAKDIGTTYKESDWEVLSDKKK